MRLWGGAQMAHTGQCRMGPARMAKPSAAPETEVVERDQMVPLYQVVLLDDDDHTYDYVIEMLQKIFIFTFDQAYRHAEEVDRYSRTVLITCELREAEYARDQIHSYGPDWRLPRSQGSMSAVIEPAPQ
jgi:ATP-dependent Clp protease adaptor protein ClpS